jgi:hypothetical protein
LQHGSTLDRRLGAELENAAPSPNEVVVGLGVHLAAHRQARLLAAREVHLESLHDAARDFVLHREDILEIPVVALGPDVAAALGVDKLRVNAHFHARLAHAAFEHVPHAELPADLLDVDALLLEGEGRVAGDDEQARDFGDVGDDVFGDAVGEVLLLGIAAHVGEGQHRDRGLARRRALGLGGGARCSGRCTAVGAHRERPHRVGDVLHLLLAPVFELGADFAPHRGADRFRYRDAAGLGEPFQPRGDVHAVAVDRAIGLFHDVAKVNADAEAHAPVLRHVLRRGSEFLLDRERGRHRAGRRFEHREHRIARHVDDAALLRLDVRPENLARGIQRRHRGALIGRHQARVARHVGSEDCCQSLLEFGTAHVCWPLPGPGAALKS